MQERVPSRGWVERRSVERPCDADTLSASLGPRCAPMVSLQPASLLSVEFRWRWP
jgi:hypothetical protein